MQKQKSTENKKILPKQKKEDSSHLIVEESKQLQGETQSDFPNKPSTIIGIILHHFSI